MVNKALFQNQYEGKTVFLTGHTGFKGSWLTFWLTLLGARVVGYSHDIPTQPSHFSVLDFQDNVTDIRGDVRDLNCLNEAITDHSPDIVFHMAAQPIVKTGLDHPVDTFETNGMGTLHVLEACRRVSSVQAIVMITSDKAYRNQEWTWGYRETDELGGSDPYSASKAVAELIIRSYSESFYDDILMVYLSYYHQ